MTSGYASCLGTTVARFATVPPPSADLAALVGVRGAPKGAKDELRAALAGADRTVASLECADEGDGAWLWRAQLGSAAEAAAAAANVAAAARARAAAAEIDASAPVT